MVLKSSILLAATAGLTALAAPTRPRFPSFPRINGTNHGPQDPCAQVAERYKMWERTNSTSELTMPGQLAFDCLQTFPFHREESVQFVRELRKFLEFQSTIEYLQQPPNGYMSPPTDLMGGMDYIEQQAAAGAFKNQYDFDDAINTLWRSGNDGHLGVGLCSQSVFTFISDLMLVSISADGVELPSIYTFQDAKVLEKHPKWVSPVVAINGEPVAAYVERRAQSQAYQDPDARYNKMFPIYANALDALPDMLISSFNNNRGIWPGEFANQRVEYANGTIAEVPFTASYNLDDEFHYPTGEAAWNWFCTVDDTTEGDDAETAKTSPAIDAPTVYPKAIVRDDYNIISGYFPDDESMSDTAVLLVTSFDTGSRSPEEPAAFANHATKFLRKAVAAGKQKLVIDLSANGGGNVNSGYDLFKALFPQKDIYSAARFRDHESLHLILKALQNIDVNDAEYDFVGSTFTLQTLIHPDQKNGFDSVAEFYGPHDVLGANMAALAASMNLDLESTEDFPIRGYGPIPIPLNATTAPFAPEDILVITDGTCTSTCTIFLELLRSEGVKTLTFGGRPQYGPVAAIGGSEGCQVADLSMFDAFGAGLLTVIIEAAKDGKPLLSVEETQRLKATFPRPSWELPFYVSYLGVNLKNAYRKGNDEVPLQFVYDPADCRLFYTLENILEPATAWTAAARAFWGEGKCVAGSRSLGY